MTGALHQSGVSSKAMKSDTTDCRSVEPVKHTDAKATSGRWVVAGLVGLAVAFVSYLALGMPGMNHPDGQMREMEHPPEQPTTGDEP